jgi:uncharacterized protein
MQMTAELKTSPGDIFFDLEGDPFVGLNGREYLFGVALLDVRTDKARQESWHHRREP